MMQPDLQRARRLVQLIANQFRGRHEDELMVDRDQVDLFWYRLGQLAVALKRSGVELTGPDAPTLPDVDASMDHEGVRPKGREVVGLARKTLDTTKPVLCAMGADPDDPALDPRAPRRDAVIETLLQLEPRLRERGISALYLFGSVARRDDGPDSDVDIAIDIDPSARERFSLFDLGGILMDLQRELESKVDLVERESIGERLRARVEVDLVRVF